MVDRYFNNAEEKRDYRMKEKLTLMGVKPEEYWIYGFASPAEMMLYQGGNRAVIKSNDKFSPLMYAKAVEYAHKQPFTKGADNMEKLSFKQVINNIKANEEYISEMHRILMKGNGSLNITSIENLATVNKVIYCDELFWKERPQVAFDEVINSNKKCRVEHEYLKRCVRLNTNEDGLIEAFDNHKRGEFIYFAELMSILSLLCTSVSFRNVIKDGVWYLE